MKYNKPWKSYQSQLDQLQARGLTVTDEPKALEHLERIGYYRLSGYLYPFRERSGVCCLLEPRPGRKYQKGQTDFTVLDSFRSGAHFQHAVDLYVFDKKLRLLTLDALERIEIALRVDIAHNLGRHDAFAYLRPDLLFAGFSQVIQPDSGLTLHHDWLAQHAKLINRSNEDFVRHNKAKYGLPLPIWITCELWDFGTLSHLYAGMKEGDQDVISAKYGVANGRTFSTWLRSLNYLRNVCAHHSRLWNRNIVDQPRLSAKGEAPLIDRFDGDGQRQVRPFLLLCITLHLLKRINPASRWGRRLRALLQTFPDVGHLGISLQGMGVLDDWEDIDW